MPDGRWVVIDLPPYATNAIWCHATGVMLPRRYWQVGGDASRPYAGPEAVALEQRVAALRERYPVARRPDATDGGR
jgi:hypothetical protein